MTSVDERGKPEVVLTRHKGCWKLLEREIRLCSRVFLIQLSLDDFFWRTLIAESRSQVSFNLWNLLQSAEMKTCLRRDSENIYVQAKNSNNHRFLCLLLSSLSPQCCTTNNSKSRLQSASFFYEENFKFSLAVSLWEFIEQRIMMMGIELKSFLSNLTMKRRRSDLLGMECHLTDGQWKIVSLENCSKRSLFQLTA